MLNKVRKLKWFVYRHDFNGKSITEFNVFSHYSFAEDVASALKKCETRDEFASEIKKSIYYYFWSKCEHEIVLTSFPPRISCEELHRLNSETDEHIRKYERVPYSMCVCPDVGEKIDICHQLMMNYDIFVDYVWAVKA